MAAIVREGAGVAAAGLTARSWDEAKAQASALARAAGFVPAVYVGKPEAVLAALMTGAELEIGPMQALRSIHIVEGRPTLSADLMLGLAIRAGVRIEWLENSDTRARARFTRAGFPDHEESFTIEEARRAGLSFKNRNGGDGMWTKYPRAMLRARVVSSALRAWSPDVLGAGAYVAGEIDPEGASETIEAGWREADTAAVDVELSRLARDVERWQETAADPTKHSDGPGPEPEREQPRPAVVPTRLADLRDEAELRAWIATHWLACRERLGEHAAGERVLGAARRLELDEGDVTGWLATATPVAAQ